MKNNYKYADYHAPRPRETVVLIHGMWMPGAVMKLLAWRLRSVGWITVVFSYSSRRATVRQNAADLAVFVEKIDTSILHFVAHSLGGLVLTQYLQNFPAQHLGRAVFLGTPYRGSYVARRLSRHCLGRWLCGLSLQGALLGDGPRWPAGLELGVIAGTSPIGLGRLIPGLPCPNDGMVALRETQVPGQTDFVSMPINHSGMVFSGRVAQQVAAFLITGRFSH